MQNGRRRHGSLAVNPPGRSDRFPRDLAGKIILPQYLRLDTDQHGKHAEYGKKTLHHNNLQLKNTVQKRDMAYYSIMHVFLQLFTQIELAKYDMKNYIESNLFLDPN